MEIQRQSGVTLCVNSYGGEVETFAFEEVGRISNAKSACRK
jgi:hypothetical protein